MMTERENLIEKWLRGEVSLGAAAGWNKDEIRIISEIAYSLAQQGSYDKAVILFEGLLAVAPATAYFQAALGALHLRLKNPKRAITYLDAALKIEENDVTSLVNRGEAQLLEGNIVEARLDLEKALLTAARKNDRQNADGNEKILTLKRARALLEFHKV